MILTLLLDELFSYGDEKILAAGMIWRRISTFVCALLAVASTPSNLFSDPELYSPYWQTCLLISHMSFGHQTVLDLVRVNVSIYTDFTGENETSERITSRREGTATKAVGDCILAAMPKYVG